MDFRFTLILLFALAMLALFVKPGHVPQEKIIDPDEKAWNEVDEIINK
mgnify:CR=1 FL=1